MSLQSSDFYVAVSMTDLFVWNGEGEHDFVGNPFLILVFNLLEIHFDLTSLYSIYFTETPIGTGDVYLYKESMNGEGIFAIDLFRDIYDQLDIIRFAIRTKKNASAVRIALQNFFASSKYQMRYEEGNILASVSSLIKESNYPKIIQQNGYTQKLVCMQSA